MKIAHLCLAAFYIDDYGYQENLLTKKHKEQGHDIIIIASTETYIDNKRIGYVEPQEYITTDGIPIKRLPYVNFLPRKLVRKLRVYKNVYKNLKDFQPDIIFMHNFQFFNVFSIIHYAKKNPAVIIYADSHTDYVNSAKNWVSKKVLHGIIYRWYAKKIEPYVTIFWATLPIRSVFMQEIYGLPKNKIKLLELGADINSETLRNRHEIKTKVLSSLGIIKSDFVIITGGKIDARKNIHLLIEAMDQLKNLPIKLIVFGTPNEEMQYLLKTLQNHESIIYLGWQNQEQINQLLLSADLGFFPGTHSVLWEQSCGLGLPCVFKKWKNIQHVDVGGNCLFLENITPSSIAEKITEIYNDEDSYMTMKKIAESKAVNHFSYDKIAKRAIEQKD